MKATNKTLYTEKSIVSETPREFCRRVPSTYLGSSKTNTNLIKEIFANSVDEVVLEHGNTINVIADIDKNRYVVQDFGQGFLINAGIDEKGRTILQRSFEVMNTSGKTTTDGVYSGTSLGVNGVGAKASNWLSTKLIVRTVRDGEYEKLWYKDGLFEKREVGKANEPSGTVVEWYPDPQFFATNEPDYNFLLVFFEEVSALIPNLTTNFTYIKGGKKKEHTFHIPEGINYLVTERVGDKELFSNRFIVDRTMGSEKISMCLTYTSDYSEKIVSFVNLGKTEGGEHISAFKSVFTRTLNKYAQETNKLKAKEKNLTSNELMEGLYVIFNVTTTTVKYDAQNKNVVDYIDSTLINQTISGDFATWLMNNPNEADIILERALVARRAREASKKAKEKIRETAKKDKTSLFGDFPTKLADAYPKNRNDRSKCEIFICLKGDTKIKLLNGTDVEIESLVDKKDFWVYSSDLGGRMVPAKVSSVFKTQEVSRLLRIRLSDGSHVECTPEHKFLDRLTGEWVEAKTLVAGQSLYSIKTKIGTRINTKDRPEIWIPGHYTKYNSKTRVKQGRWVPLHRYIKSFFEELKQGYDVHHKDLNRLNNDPENLLQLPKKEHLAIHNRINYDNGIMKYEDKHFTEESRYRMQYGSHFRTEEGVERQREAARKSWENDRHNPNRTWARYNANERYDEQGRDKTLVAKYLKCVKAFLDNGVDVTPENWKKHKQRLLYPLAPNYTTIVDVFGSIDTAIEEAKNYNLSVISIEEVHYENAIPVYCLNVENEYHSFVLENGLVTHNCEGDSASVNIKDTRDSTFQACFPVRGKVLNCLKATTDKVYANAEISGLVKALGLKVDENTGKLVYDAKKLRYSKIIIACFTGDTKVKSLDGNSYSFKELVDNNVKTLWTYSIDKNGNVVPSLAKNIRKIKETNKLVKITLDNGKVIKCTLDHKFMLPDLSYEEAQNLKVGQSLMPIYTKIENKHEMYFDRNSGKYKYTHDLVGNTILAKEKEDALDRLQNEEHYPSQDHICIHHKGVFAQNNSLNNTPENLEWLTLKEHFIEHSKLNKTDRGKEYFRELHKEGKLKNWGETYNGSEKHIEDVKNAWKEGKYANCYNHFAEYNKTQANKDSCKKSNSNPLHILHSKQTKSLKTLKYLIENGFEVNEENYNYNKCQGAVLFSNLNTLFSSLEEAIELSNNVDISNYSLKREQDNNVEVWKRSRVASVIKKLVDKGLELNEENYNSVRNKKDKDPKFETILTVFDSYDDAYEAGKHYNHKIVDIEYLDVENEPVYCMEVPEYHNFLLDADVVIHNCDGDSDGNHISLLLITALNWLCPELLTNGHVYRVYSALFKVTFPDGTYLLFQDDKSFDAWREKNPNKKYKVTRAKGLGELTKEEAYEQLTQVSTRNLKQLEVSDYDEFMRVLTIAMGEDSTQRSELLDIHYEEMGVE